jgi:hypothetical protein
MRLLDLIKGKSCSVSTDMEQSLKLASLRHQTASRCLQQTLVNYLDMPGLDVKGNTDQKVFDFAEAKHASGS